MIPKNRAGSREQGAGQKEKGGGQRKRAPHGREAAQQELPWPRPYKPTFAPGICFQCGGKGHLR